jgi:acetyl esterase
VSASLPKAQAAVAPDLDPQIRRFVETTSAAYGRFPDLATLPLVESRRVCELVRAPWVDGGPEIAKTVERRLPTRHGGVRVRVYDPLPGRPKPALVYLHGGGWTIFSLDTHDRLMREYAQRAEMAVVGVDYALSPEAKFPVALEQTADVLAWLAKHGDEIEIDGARLAVGGDSAGANLALSASLLLRDSGAGEVVRAMVLNYGLFDCHISQDADRRYGGPGYMLTAAECAGFMANYTRSVDDVDNPLVCPIKADLVGLPPTLLVIPECDVLTEQSHALAERLLRAGVSVDSKIYRGATHSFLEAVSIAAVADRAISDTTVWLRQSLRG